ncbi:UNVERIFIED_CONTAM: hypothetical protein FKN15_022011 [Acipenser sinensis]
MDRLKSGFKWAVIGITEARWDPPMTMVKKTQCIKQGQYVQLQFKRALGPQARPKAFELASCGWSRGDPCENLSTSFNGEKENKRIIRVTLY